MRFYKEFASWWPLLSPPEAYEEEATVYAAALKGAADGEVRTVLELGSGGGSNASHMKRHFEMTLVDPAPGMLEVSRALNPDCVHFEGDMRTIRLKQTFDAVFVQDAVGFMRSKDDLQAAIATAVHHVRPGGAVLFAPDHTKENFRESVDCDGADEEGRSLRYLEWTFDPDPTDTTYEVHYTFLLREGDGPVRVVHDPHVEGIFAVDQWLGWLNEAGVDARIMPVDLTELDPGTYDIFVGRRRR